MLIGLAEMLGSLVSSRVYPLVLPQKPTLPAITYQQISAVRVRNLPVGRAGKVRLRIQIDCWAETYAAVHALADSVKALLDATATERVLDNEFDLFESETGVDGLWRVMQEYVISVREEIS